MTDLRVAGLGRPAVPNAARLAAVSGIRVTVPSIAPSRSPPPTSTRGSAGSRCSAPTAASSSRCSCCSGASPIAARQVDSTVGDGTACARRHGTAASSPEQRGEHLAGVGVGHQRHQQHRPDGERRRSSPAALGPWWLP